MNDLTPEERLQREFMFHFGSMIAAWNLVEFAAKDILTTLCGSTPGSYILSHQIGNASITDAIRVLTTWHPQAKDHLVHFTKLMDTLRAYRNFYVHNIHTVRVVEEHPFGVVMALNVKGKFGLHEKALSIPELTELCEHLDHAHKYGGTIKMIVAQEVSVETYDQLALLEKPSLPETLKKPPHDPLISWILPESSQSQPRP